MRTFATPQLPIEDDRLDSVDQALNELFEALQARPVPTPLLALVGRLEAASQPLPA